MFKTIDINIYINTTLELKKLKKVTHRFKIKLEFLTMINLNLIYGGLRPPHTPISTNNI